MSKHSITVQEAQEMIAAHAAAQTQPFSEANPRNIGFEIEVLQELAHPEAVTFRVHHAIHEGKSTMVLASHAADGSILVAAQNGLWCPPFC